MTVVVDANVIVSLVLPLAYSDLAARRLRDWTQARIDLQAPYLMQYEMTTVLRKAIANRLITIDQATEGLARILALGISYVPPTLDLHTSALQLADRLGHSKAYDAHYLALAERSGGDLWTADRRLAAASQQHGLRWVHWIGEQMAT